MSWRGKIILTFGAAILLPVACLLYTLHDDSPKKTFQVGSIETTISWSNGSDVEINATSIGKLNAELDQLLAKEFPGRGIHYPVISIGRRRVQTMYVLQPTPPEPMTDDIQKKLNAYIQKRLPELAREQVEADQSN